MKGHETNTICNFDHERSIELLLTSAKLSSIDDDTLREKNNLEQTLFLFIRKVIK